MKACPIEFDDPNIRRVHDKATATWWFAVIDVLQMLTQQTDALAARRYWNQLKHRLDKEGSQLVTSCRQMKMTAADGKQRLMDVATAETLLGLIQSVSNPKAEPIKLWMAKVGFECMQETTDPALLLDRARQTWRQQGHGDEWITQRMNGQEPRSKLPDHWSEHDKKDRAFDTPTNQSPRDHTSEAELIFNALAELSTQQIAESAEITGMMDNKSAAKAGGCIAARARKELERQMGKREATGTNFLPPVAIKSI
ncbi:MAG: hypothetical protein IPN53_07990 [Comamonadaceae bacterium]|nr:hypothetical protein [Comamonadaceae bacterium]